MIRIGLLMWPGLRARSYLGALEAAGLAPDAVLRLGGDDGPPADLRDPAVREAVVEAGCDWFVFSGGGIVREPLLSCGPRWLHVHPGLLPHYRGSTCIHWSLLREGKVGASAFELAPGLDTGDLLVAREATLPAGTTAEDLDHAFDARLRSELLVEAVRGLRDGTLQPRPQPPGGHSYTIIHPALKHLAVRRALAVAATADTRS